MRRFRLPGGRLWSHRDFLKLWTGQSISEFGSAVSRWVVWGTIPLGALAGGAFATWWGLRTALWIGAIGGLFTFLPVALTPIRSIREIPAPVEPLTAVQAELEGGLVEGTSLPARHAADA